MKKRLWIGIVLIVLLIVFVPLLYSSVIHVSPSGLRQWIVSFGFWSPLFYILIYTFRPIVLFPSSILSIAGGLAFGAFFGTLYTILGALSGAALSFVIARKVGQQIGTEQTSNETFNKIQNNIQQKGFFYVLLLRLIPIVNFDAVSYLAGLSNIRFKSFMIATSIGMLPGTFAYNFLGNSIASENPKMILIAIGLFICIIAILYMLKKKIQI